MRGEAAGDDAGRVLEAVERQVSLWASNERGGREGSETDRCEVAKPEWE